MNQIVTKATNAEIEEMKAQLPSDWANQFLQHAEQVLKKRYTRQTPYKILNGGKKHHDGWKIIEKIAERHQENLAKL